MHGPRSSWRLGRRGWPGTREGRCPAGGAPTQERENVDLKQLVAELSLEGRRLKQALQDRGVKISMDWKGRWADNIFVERLWRTVKYEEVCLKAYVNAVEARRELGAYFWFYNNLRPHQALGYRTLPRCSTENEMSGNKSKGRRCAPGEGAESLAGPSLNSALILSSFPGPPQSLTAYSSLIMLSSVIVCNRTPRIRLPKPPTELDSPLLPRKLSQW